MSFGGGDRFGAGSKEKDIVEVLRPFRYLLMIAALVVVTVVWVFSGVYSVGPGEQGVVRRFGKETARTLPGLRFRLPRPFETHDVVDIASVRRAEVGFRTEGRPPRQVTEDREALMLTGDENIIEVHLFVQYVIKDAGDYLFNVRDPEEVLRTTAEAALRTVVGMNTVDHTMTEGRAEIQGEVQEFLQNLMDLYGTGILVTDARLLVVDPPRQVRESFHDVVRAWEDRERLVQEAEGYREDILPRARGEAFEVVQQAEAHRERRVLRAQGDAARFLAMLSEYEQAPEVTRERLFLEMAEEVLPGVKLYLLDPSASQNLTQFLPIEGMDALRGGGR